MGYIICDLDGTLCDHSHRKHMSHLDFDHYNGLLHLDHPRQGILYLLSAMESDGHYVILITGRPEQYREATEDWLWKHTGVYFEHRGLYMRPTGNMESDIHLKASIFESLPDDVKRDVLFVLEDRDCVVDMWRDLGLLCLQVERFEVNKKGIQDGKK